MNITFHGAAQSVTGSCHLIEVNGSRILLDCGMFQGKRAEAFEKNASFPFDPASINVLILSHAHIDHSGKIPMLCKLGFTGTIFCTHATRDLANIMLLDSGYVQQKDAEFVNKRNLKKGHPLVEPLYSIEDAINSLEQFQTVSYKRPFLVADGVRATFYDAGHILGSASVALDINDNGTQKRIVYSGDIGRWDRPIIRDPEFPGDCDVIISESTYGGRFHVDDMTLLDKLEAIVRTAVSRRSKIIVPAFSVGRTQELVYSLHVLRTSGRLPDIPIYVDSPLSFSATQIYKGHPECMDPDVRDEILIRHDPFGFENLRYVMSVDESKALNGMHGPMMIISASGMCEAGRILHHLANNIEDPRNIIMITGYSAEHTLGRRIVEKNPTVNIFGEPYSLKAEVITLNSLSAHADKNELLRWFKQFDNKRARRVYIVHGDYDQQQKLQASLSHELGYASIEIPGQGASFTE
jgi:metallo-beta-lactamase family protein